MKKTEFKVTGRKDSRIMRTIHAHMDEPEWNMTLHLDNLTGDVYYPVLIEPVVPIMTITLDSDTTLACLVPPSIPDTMVDMIIKHLSSSHDVVVAARKLIEDEQKMFRR